MLLSRRPQSYPILSTYPEGNQSGRRKPTTLDERQLTLFTNENLHRCRESQTIKVIMRSKILIHYQLLGISRALRQSLLNVILFLLYKDSTTRETTTQLMRSKKAYDIFKKHDVT